MKITEDRFRSILAGTATDLSSKEILIRIEAFDAERQGRDPMATVEARLPDVTIVRSDAGSKTGAKKADSIGSVGAKNLAPSRKDKAASKWQDCIASIRLLWRKLFRREPAKEPQSQSRSGAAVGTVSAGIAVPAGRSQRAAKSDKRPFPAGERQRFLSPELIAFSQRHGIPVDQFFDARGMSKAEYVRQMNVVGAVIAYNVSPCAKAGHSVRNRYGKCVACDPKQIAFNQRATEAGFVYAAYSPSKRLVKVGFTKNVRRRHNDLIRQRYAGASDWDLYYQKESMDGGRREIEAHKSLARYAVKGLTYVRDGRTQVADEVFQCSKQIAVEALGGRP